MMGDINEKKIDISDKIIKRLQNDKETLLEKIEGQEILLNLLYDDMEKKNKDVEDLKKQVVEGVACEERTEFERKKKQFATLCREIDNKIEKRNEEFKHLKKSIKELGIKCTKPKPRCTFEWKCKNVVCRFDHSHLNSKINTFQKKAAPNFKHNCSFCGMTLESKNHLEAHRKKCQEKANIISVNFVHCSICNERFESQSQMKKHMKKSHKRDDLKCAKCGKFFDLETEVQSHMEKHLDDEKMAKEITSMIDTLLNKNCELKEPSMMKSKAKSEKKITKVSTKKKPAKKLRKPVKFEVIEEDLSDDSLAESGEVIEEDLSDDCLAESDDTNKSEISNDEDSSSEEESGGEYDEEIPDAVQ